MNQEQRGKIFRRIAARKRIGGRNGMRDVSRILRKRNAAKTAAFFDKESR
jgi:hypothetical protein